MAASCPASTSGVSGARCPGRGGFVLARSSGADFTEGTGVGIGVCVVGGPQHLHMGLADLRARFHAEVLDEAGAQVAVDGEGLGAAAGAVQGEHELAVVGLTERMLGGERGQLRYQPVESGAADGELGVVAPLQEEQPGLGEALREGVSAQVERQAVERCAAPQGERAGALAQHPLPVARGVGSAGRRDVAFEDVDVQLAPLDPQDVPGRHGPQPFGVVQQPAQPGHVVVQRGVRGGGWREAPQRVLERVDGDHPAGLQEQRGQQGADLGTADRRDAGVLDGPAPVGVGRGLGGGALGVVEDRWSQQPEPQLVPTHAAHRPPLSAEIRPLPGGFPPPVP